MQAVIDFRLASLEPHRHVFETCRVSANFGGASTSDRKIPLTQTTGGYSSARWQIR